MSERSELDVMLSDVLRLALPLSTEVAAGADQTRRRVKWVGMLVEWEGFHEQVGPDDLALVPPSLQADLTARQFSAGVRTLADLPIAAMVTFRPIPVSVRRQADKADLPILVVPEGYPVRDIHRDLASLLLDRQAQTVERGMQLYRKLSAMSRGESGLPAMIDVMAKLTGKLVVLQDKRLEIKAHSLPPASAIDLERVITELGRRENLPDPLRNRKAVAQSRQTHWQQLLPVDNLGRLVSPVIAGDRARGYLSIIGPPDELDELDTLTAEHGAAACAMEMAKAKAVNEARKALRGDFLEGLLAGNLPRSEMERLAARLDHDTDALHAVLAVAWREPDGAGPSLRRLETEINWLQSTQQRPYLVHLYSEEHICVFYPLRRADDMVVAHDFSESLQSQLDAAQLDAPIVIGLAGPAGALTEWPAAHERAVQAMQLGRRLKLSRLVEFDSLGIYQLLCQLEDLPAVKSFYKQLVGPLAEYDRQHKSNLVNTLEAYFRHHCNISQTAETLFIHRNTLLYRLERIQALTGRDLDQADMRLAFHLALKLWQLHAGVAEAPDQARAARR